MNRSTSSIPPIVPPSKTAAFVALLLAAALLIPATASASSHREAPAITESPQVDGTDFYMFRSYEPGRAGFVTLIANYNPLQDPYGGPNYFPLDSDAFYDIRITNDGDAVEDLTFRFRFRQSYAGISLDVGDAGATRQIPIPLVNAGQLGAALGQSALNVRRSYTVRLIRGPIDNPTDVSLLRPKGGNRPAFMMPFDNIGTKSIPDYDAYAATFIHDIAIPGCGDGRLFAGQRKEPFAVNLGETFDLVNLNPLGPVDGESSDTADKNITSLILEVPIDCLTGNGPVVAGWTTSWLPRTRELSDTPSFDAAATQSGDFVQVSRLANPLVNEVVIGLADKNRFNASQPDKDAQFLDYVTHPSLPELLELLFGVEAPNNFPRNDLVAAFLTGIDGLNQDGSVGELMRLNTDIPPTPRDQQNPLGVAAGDPAGFPNGRRPGDDTVDIALRAVMGLLCHLDLGLCTPADAPAGLLPLTDGAIQNAQQFDNQFPYLTTPIPGAPNP